MTTTQRRRSRVDLAMVLVVRLANDPSWVVAAAAAQVRSQVSDPWVLRCARARVAATLAKHRSAVGERAMATLDAALADTVTELHRPARTGPLDAPVRTPGPAHDAVVA
jgi:hypothetical protein